MATRRKAHPDHYQTHPAAPHDGELPHGRPRGEKSERASHPGQRTAEPTSIRAGERAVHALLLHCVQCGASAAVIGGQTVNVCKECGGASYRLSA